ncbi:MAG TPA: SGNH/GDSL hydrolase family protein [Gemmatimonadaceae bacterium]|nr:SGNH/GDSL hydrolase family protein [Gemmatimonadaceae bacterium]
MRRRYLALGDSYTIGEGVGAEERWPVRLWVALEALGIALTEPRIIAKTGWTTFELLEAIAAASTPPLANHDLVTLLIGVNDQYRGYGIELFRSGFEALLARAIELAGNAPRRVVVVSIPDWSVTPFAVADPRERGAIAAQIDAFNAVADELATSSGAVFVDVTADSRRAAHDRDLLAADSLHPSAAMYESWASLILPAARQALGG